MQLLIVVSGQRDIQMKVAIAHMTVPTRFHRLLFFGSKLITILDEVSCAIDNVVVIVCAKGDIVL